MTHPENTKPEAPAEEVAPAGGGLHVEAHAIKEHGLPGRAAAPMAIKEHGLPGGATPNAIKERGI
jgi:hypothetical protein